MYKGLSYSPMHGSFAPGYEPAPSDLENLIAGRERKISDFVDQSIFESLFSGEVEVPFCSGGRITGLTVSLEKRPDSCHFARVGASRGKSICPDSF